MKEGIIKFLKITLLVLACILVILLIFGFVIALYWPWWVGFFLLLLLAGMVFGFIVLRKIWLRRREKNFVRDISEQDIARIQALSANDKSEMKDLQDRWRSAIDTVRGSHLRKLGNPLYVLPWYMVIGESGSGKTTSLNSARLASPFSEVDRVSGVSGTKQCEWWFFEQAVVIDTAGRYAIPINEGQDKEEWQKFLSLLLKYRRREPLNGLIITVAADRLLKAPKEDLEEYGRTIRQRMDELMRALGMRFPVYVLATKCDLVQGVNRFCENLPDKSLVQPMGIINQDLSGDVETFVERAVATIDERLRNLRLQLLHQPDSRGADPALLLFPEEFETLKQGLASFMSGAFRRNPYQETPMLRGIFFSSGRQEGSPHSHFSKTLGECSEDEALPGTNKGLFLHDFFAKVLPGDRSLLAPTRKALEWRLLTGNLGLTSWVIVGIALCGLLSFSFVKNVKSIRDVSREFTTSLSLRGDMSTDLVTMDSFRKEIMNVEEKNSNWWFPRFWLNESLKLEAFLKNRYCRMFRDGLLAPYDKQLAGTLPTISSATPDDLYGQYAVHLVRRINILRARQGNNDLDGLKAKPQPSYIALMSSQPAAGIETRKTFGSLYLYYLIWRDDPGDLSRETTVLQSWLRQVTAVKGPNMQWLTSWTDTQSGLPSVTLGEFWGGSLAAEGEKTIPPSFTRKGKESVDSLLAELEAAHPVPSSISSNRTAFAEWYRGAAFSSWQGFVAGFSKGAARLRGVSEWRQTAARMSTEQGPYFALLNRLALEIEPLVTAGPLPPWLQQVYQYQTVRAQGVIRNAGAVTRVKTGGGKFIEALRRNIGREADAKILAAQTSAGKSYTEYRNALSSITQATASRNLSFQLASQTFSEDPINGKSPFYVASSSGDKLKTGLAGGATETLFSQLINGPVEFLWTFVRRESACQLQSLWEEQVLAGTMGMTSQQAMPMLVGPDGLAWRFAKGPALPFLKGNMYGYGAKEALGETLPLDNSLFSFLGRGAKTQATVIAMGRPQNFNVGIRGLPTDANAEAKLKPHATRLELQCGGSSQSLVNNNYPVGKTFNWSPDSCGDVLFQIEVGDSVLTRHYMGPEGFPDFLKDFRGGKRTFSVRDFPGERASLERMGIRHITVNYQFIGSVAIRKQTATLSGHAPRSIARCWAP
ncbi:MAG: type VI secretion system protein ImpL [Deltaproteobacteria bacterium]|nr:type VI secretion system protein ImpL [Deltaproteobacteria bacterium]